MLFLLHWLLAACAIMITGSLISGVRVSGFFAAILATLVLGLVNALVKPLLLILTLPINTLTIGLFTLVINGLMILLVSALVPGFDVGGLWPAILFSLVLSILNFLFSLLLPD